MCSWKHWSLALPGILHLVILPDFLELIWRSNNCFWSFPMGWEFRMRSAGIWFIMNDLIWLTGPIFQSMESTVNLMLMCHIRTNRIPQILQLCVYFWERVGIGNEKHQTGLNYQKYGEILAPGRPMAHLHENSFFLL